MNDKTATLALSHACELGEGPIWDALNGILLWVDILMGEIHQFSPSRGEHKITKIGHTISSLSIRSAGGLIATLQNGFAQIDLEKNMAEYIAQQETHLTNNRFNDGKCDPAGRFWAGSMDYINGTERAGNLYVLDTDLAVSVKIKGVTCSNGMAWSADLTRFYYIDTPTRQVVAYDYDVASGQIGEKQVIITIPVADGLPDGMTIDQEGMLWVALWDGWKVVRYNPDTGKMIDAIHLPVAKVTSCTFGGDTFEDLYITTAKTGLSQNELTKQPFAGCLFVYKNIRYRGMPPALFQG